MSRRAIFLAASGRPIVIAFRGAGAEFRRETPRSGNDKEARRGDLTRTPLRAPLARLRALSGFRQGQDAGQDVHRRASVP